MPAQPQTDDIATPAPARGPERRRSHRRSADVIRYRQDEDVLRSFFAQPVSPPPTYGMGYRARAMLVTLAASTAGGAFVVAALHFFGL